MSISIPARQVVRVPLQRYDGWDLKAGPLGTGAGVLMTEYNFNGVFRKSPQELMRQYIALGMSVPWIRSAERVIAGNCSTVDWHLEDAEDNEIDENAKGDAGLAMQLLEKPQLLRTIGKKMTRREMWALTFRHMGLAGSAFWYGDQMNGNGIPTSWLYVRPDRMTPAEDSNGNLIDWVLDADPARGLSGVPLGLENVLQFQLDPPDQGHFGQGLVQSALTKIALSQGVDRHMQYMLDSGGRLSGFLSPKDGTINDTLYQQIINDFRAINEAPDAAKRLQVLRGPVDFISTTLSPAELHIRDLMVGSRDDLLQLWGVPLSQIGGTPPAGLNSGDVRKFDEASLWQNANHPRLVSFVEVVQMGFLDRFQATGTYLELEVDEPEFDDDSARYDLVLKSVSTSMRNDERRDLIGLPPFPDDVIGVSGKPIGEEVWMPVTMVLAFSAAEDANQPPDPSESALGRGGVADIEGDNVAAGNAAGETASSSGSFTPGTRSGGAVTSKAVLTPRIAPLVASLHVLRENVAKSATPKLKAAIHTALQQTRADVADRLRKHAAQVASHPADVQTYFNATAATEAMSRAMAPHLVGMATAVSAHIGATLAPIEQVGKASPETAAHRAMTRGAARVTNITETTRAKIRDAVVAAINAGSTVQDLADELENGDGLGGTFDEYRAEMIARTELMDAYNFAAIGSYSDAGVEYVQAIDGDGDAECAARDGQTFTTDDAGTIEDHPNGTLDWAPVFSGKASHYSYTGDPLSIAQGLSEKASALVEHVSGMQMAQAALAQNAALADGMNRMAEAFANQPAPIVQVPDFPEIPAPIVQVAPPDLEGLAGALGVHTQTIMDGQAAQTAAIVDGLRQKSVQRTVQRDQMGRISGTLDEPVIE